MDVNRTYPRDIPDLFEGGQIVWAGRYRQSGRTTIRVTGKVAGESRSLEFPAELAGTFGGSGHDFVERLWAVRRLGDLIDQIDMHGQNRELIDELVSLSTKYGILTPYTSFLADERVQLHVAANNRMAEGELKQLGEVTGRAGVQQRDVKQRFMNAKSSANFDGFAYGESSAADGAAMVDPLPSQGQAGQNQGVAHGNSPGTVRGKRRTMAGAQPLQRATPATAGVQGAPLAARLADDREEQKTASAGKVRHIGSKTFYWKKERWTDSSVTEEEAEKATLLSQLSDEYFRLASTQKSENNQYLTLDEPAVVKLDGKVYRVEPVKKEKAGQAP